MFIALILFLFFAIPGLIYSLVYGGYKMVCPTCGHTIIQNKLETSTKEKQIKQSAENSSTLKWMFGIGAVIWLIWLGSNSENSPPPANTASAPTVQPPAPIFNQPEQPLPQTGENNATFQDGVAPLTIKTSSSGGYHYFVKIVNLLNNQPLGAYFIRSGGIIEIQVPLGTYEIKYASGTKWYGVDYLFGTETTYSKAESTLNFTFDGYQYSGYTVELIMQRNGNLRTSRIQPDQW